MTYALHLTINGLRTDAHLQTWPTRQEAEIDLLNTNQNQADGFAEQVIADYNAFTKEMKPRPTFARFVNAAGTVTEPMTFGFTIEDH
jgi:hypothetical protein